MRIRQEKVFLHNKQEVVVLTWLTDGAIIHFDKINLTTDTGVEPMFVPLKSLTIRYE